jgi:hypothetical protein
VQPTMTTFQDLLSQHVGTSFARQLAFADFLGDRNWSVDVQQGIVTFGRDLRFSIQLLGTEAERDSSWLWAWANKESNLPEQVLCSCNELRELGNRKGIQEFSERTFSLEVADGHSIALIASGIDGKCCYYRGPYEGGALFFLVSDVPRQILGPVESERAVTVITQVISQFTVDHRAMAESFLKSQGFAVELSENSITATRHSDTITLSFDGQRRISQIGGTVQAKQQTQKKSWWQFWKT